MFRTAPQALPFLYIKDSPQCNECSMRFPAGEDGKIKLRDHLDQHFRQNVKSNENLGRGFSRSWFVGKKVCSFVFTAIDFDAIGRTGPVTSRSIL